MTHSHLVSCEWLKNAIDSGENTNFVLLDVSWFPGEDARKKYESQNIPGAIYFDVLTGPHTELLPRNIPSAEQFQSHARDVGINSDTKVIVYSSTAANGFYLSGRAWWTFQLFGHTHISVLDGGLAKWISLGYKTTSTVPSSTKPTGNFTAKVNLNLMKTFEETMGLKPESIQICDTRPAGSFIDPGHIVGAVSLPMTNLLNMENGTLKPQALIKQEFDKAKIDLSKPVICYCNTGMTASTVFMAATIIGCSNLSLYMGGFTEWKSRAPAEKIAK